jgi:DNA-binding MarR family transcriptional regulator
VNAIHNNEGCPAVFTGTLERIFAFAAAVDHYMQAGLVARGLTRARAAVVWQLHRFGPATQQRLAGTIGVTARNVTALVDGLVESGFVRRQPHPADRRAVLVTLTDAGREVTERLLADYEAGAAALFDGLPDDEVRGFLATMDLLGSRLRHVG